jgi:hypothetical protein
LRGRAQILGFLALLGLLGGRLFALAPPAQAAGGSYVVDSTSDEVDQAIGDGVCLTASGDCTLRAAIDEGSRDQGASTIAFDIPGAGPHTIALTSSLPYLYDGAGGTTIDGYTQPGAEPNSAANGSNAVLKVEIRGTGSSSFEAININSPDNVVRGLAIYDVRIGVTLIGEGATNNAIVGNFIGTDASGTFGNEVRDSNANGVLVRNGATSNLIGRPALADRNIISGGPANGVVIGAIALSAPTNNNLVQNNVIGLGPDGSPLPNRAHGIDINLGASQNMIGGVEPGAGNVVSGNEGSGVEVSHGRQTSGNQVVANRIGTDLTGTTGPDGARNGQANVHLEDQVTNSVVAYNTIGTIPRHIADGGIKVDHVFGSSIHHNHIGVSESGGSISNGPYGVQVERGSTDTVVGPGNIITNNSSGIRIQDDDTVGVRITENTIFANAGLGIDISPLSVVNANDPGDGDGGPNTRLNFPEVTQVAPTFVRGTTCDSCRVEVFLADSSSLDPGQPGSYGEGRTLLGANVAGTDGNFEVPLPAAATSRVVTTTATDVAGNTSEFSPNKVVSPAPVEVASDQFSRTASNGWGPAEIGGPWTPRSYPPAFSVDGSVGRIRTPAGRIRQVDLLDVNEADVDARMTVTTSRAPFMGSHEVGFALRRVDAATMYLARLRYGTLGRLYLGVEGGGAVLDEVEVVDAPPIGTPLILRAEVVGVSPTRIRVKTWAAGTTEPDGWALTVEDSTPALQHSGAIGVVSASTELVGRTPVVVTVDDLSARTATPAAPK